MPVYNVPKKPEYASALADLALNGPVNADMGICYNLSVKVPWEYGDAYEYMATLFSAPLDCDPDDASCPLPDNGWDDGVRRRWCSLFAEACCTGVLDVPDNLMSTLRPV